MWLAGWHLAEDSGGSLPTNGYALIGYVVGTLIIVGLPLLVSRLRHPPAVPPPQPQATHELAQNTADRLERALQAHIDALTSSNTRLTDENEELREENEQLNRDNARLLAENEQWAAHARYGSRE